MDIVEKRINELKTQYDQLQVGLSENQIAIGDGIVLDAIHPDSKFGFEFFCYRSPFGMVEEMNWFINYADGKKSFLDVGAFDGVFSLVFAKLNPDGKAVAIEPSTQPNSRLLYNIHNAGNIEAHKVAFSDYNGYLTMSKEWEHLVEDENGDEKVLCYRGDDFLEGQFFDIIKIDVERHEKQVLEGLKGIIVTYKPIIFLELHCNNLPKSEILEIGELINDFGYNVIDTKNGEDFKINAEINEDKRLILMP